MIVGTPENRPKLPQKGNESSQKGKKFLRDIHQINWCRISSMNDQKEAKSGAEVVGCSVFKKVVVGVFVSVYHPICE